jgi:hypothetical protein
MPRFALLMAAAALLASCATSDSSAPHARVDTHEAMVRWVNPAALAVWDVTNTAMSDEGGLDPALMTNAAWTKLGDAAKLLELHSRHMADAQVLWVGAHNDEVEGFATRAEIQAMIDADPAGFRALSHEMELHAGELASAATARDITQAGNLADGLSERCQACHSRYWEKPAL